MLHLHTYIFGTTSKKRNILRESTAKAKLVRSQNSAQKLRSTHSFGHRLSAEAQRELLLHRTGQSLQVYRGEGEGHAFSIAACHRPKRDTYHLSNGWLIFVAERVALSLGLRKHIPNALGHLTLGAVGQLHIVAEQQAVDNRAAL